MKLHLSRISNTIFHSNKLSLLQFTRFLSTQEAFERRHHLFTLEKKRQLEKVGRIEKIEIKYVGLPKECTLVMNKDISTPYDCARHISEWHMESSALALLDGHQHYDMHRPLNESCSLEFQTFNSPDPMKVNKAFWRTCSMMLGVVACGAFKDNVDVQLHSFPGPSIRTGSFIYDIDLPSLPDWQPTLQELHTLGAEFVLLCRQNLPIERLEVGEELASEMFVDNQHKIKQIPNIAKANGKITLYRIGKHVDISRGPLISHTGQVGRASVAAVHRLRAEGGPRAEDGPPQLYRFQGVALPAGVVLNHFTYEILVQRAKKLNRERSPINPKREDKPKAVAATA